MTAIDFSKALTGDVSVMSFYAKRLLAGGEVAFQKHDFIAAIEKRAAEIYPDRLTPAQKFSRCICDDDTGRLLYRACKAASGSEVRPPVEKQDTGPVHIGPAHAKMHSLAIDRQKERGIPYSSAYSEVYVHGDNASLRAAVQREHLEHQLSLTHGGGGVTHTLSSSEAENLDGKVPSFRGTGYDRDIAAKKSAEAEIQKLADRYRSEHPNITAAQAYTHVLTLPQHREIAKRALAVA